MFKKTDRQHKIKMFVYGVSGAALEILKVRLEEKEQIQKQESKKQYAAIRKDTPF